MASSKTRSQIVEEALTRAGRDVSLRELGNTMLNGMLRKWALEYKYPVLRKLGSVQTLSAGSSSLALPSDLGAGVDSLLLGTERFPLYERSSDEFIQSQGYPDTSNPSVGKPVFYMVDQEAELARFNTSADQAYPVQFVYFKAPADLSLDSTDDALKVWCPDDELVIQGLIQLIYQYNNDEREGPQYQLVQALKGQYRAGSVPMGGGINKILLSPRTFPRRRR